MKPPSSELSSPMMAFWTALLRVSSTTRSNAFICPSSRRPPILRMMIRKAYTAAGRMIFSARLVPGMNRSRRNVVMKSVSTVSLLRITPQSCRIVDQRRAYHPLIPARGANPGSDSGRTSLQSGARPGLGCTCLFLGLVQQDRALDEGQVREGLREVAEHLAGLGVDLL